MSLDLLWSQRHIPLCGYCAIITNLHVHTFTKLFTTSRITRLRSGSLQHNYICYCILFFRTFILIFFFGDRGIPQTYDEMLTPLKPKTFPILNPASKCSPWGQFVQPVAIPRFTCIICATFIPNRSSRLTTFPKTPQKAAVGYRGANCF